MGHCDNPAGRLLLILRRAKTLEFEEKHPNVFNGWARAFNVDPGDTPLVFHKMAMLWELPLIIRTRMQSITDINTDAYSHWIPMIDGVIRTHQLNTGWREHIAAIPEAALGSLETCSDALSRHFAEKGSNEESLGPLLEDVQRLVSDVICADMDQRLKDYLLKHLDLIERAIQDYEFFGPGGLRTSLESVLGSFIVEKDSAANAAETPLGERFWEIVRKLAMVVTITGGVLQLPETVGKLLSVTQE